LAATCASTCAGGAGDTELFRKYAAELVALAPDVLVAAGGPLTQALQRATRTVPIVFASAIDPVGGGFVESLARPGGNITGFMAFEFSLGGKWLELLKQVAPNVTQAVVLRNSGHCLRGRHVCCDPGGGAIAGGRTSSGRHTECR
jgi:ABC-type uncharacterized transport system substrate-binding protein